MKRRRKIGGGGGNGGIGEIEMAAWRSAKIEIGGSKK